MKRLLFIATSILFFTASGTAQTQEVSLGAIVSPSIIESVAAPGESVEASFTLESTSSEVRPISLYASSLIPVDDIIDQSRRNEFDASAWVTIDEPNVVLSPSERQTVTATIDVPVNANPGGHYAYITARILQPTNENEQRNGAVIQPEIGIALLITVPGDVVESAQLNTNSLSPGITFESDSKTLTFSVANDGNVHILPSPRLRITGPNKYEKVFSLQPQLILPNTEKQFEVDWLVDGSFGNYKVQAELVYGNQSIPLANQPTSFLVLPPIWQWLVAILIGAISFIVFRTRRNIKPAISQLGKSDKAKTEASTIKIPHDQESYEEVFSDSDNAAETEIKKALEADHVTQIDDRFAKQKTTVIKTKATTIIQSTSTDAPTNPTSTSSAVVTSKTLHKKSSKPKTSKVTKIAVTSAKSPTKPTGKKKQTITKKTTKTAKKTDTKKVARKASAATTKSVAKKVTSKTNAAAKKTATKKAAKKTTPKKVTTTKKPIAKKTTKKPLARAKSTASKKSAKTATKTTKRAKRSTKKVIKTSKKVTKKSTTTKTTKK